ncbi:hypothetical protein MLD38_002287 [Melastoma candidum]|uniref:Uncharacterized protein n=1 Tax=Melastoma candidum TaxID=119954 RepID=A0ACB9SG13_9MYRT|nr:hypothetical protein MLD38_002287 [Melastoma candidum]
MQSNRTRMLPAISPFRLSSLLRRTSDPEAALRLFLNPTPSIDAKPFRHSLLSYELVISKLCRARMFPEVESVLLRLRLDTRLSPPESLFCRVISSYARSRLPHLALRAFLSIPSFPNPPTLSIRSLNCLLHAFSIAGLFQTMLVALEEHGRGHGLLPDVCTYNILINACFARGSLSDARKMFVLMRERGVVPNAVTFGTLINGLCAEGRMEEALRLKDDMGKVFGVKGNANAYAPLIKAACNVGDMALAFRIKEEMAEQEIKLDSAVYATLMNGLYRAGRSEEEVRGVLEEMKQIGCKMDTVCYNVMIQERCKSSDFAGAFGILDDIVKNGCKPDVISYNMIVTGLCKEGKLEVAKDLFEDMPRRGCKPDVVTHRVLFDALLGAVRIREAVDLLDEMAFKGFTPRSTSARELVDCLCDDVEGNEDELTRVLCSLGKVKAVPVDSWATVVSRACNKDDLQGLLDSLNQLGESS